MSRFLFLLLLLATLLVISEGARKKYGKGKKAVKVDKKGYKKGGKGKGKDKGKDKGKNKGNDKSTDKAKVKKIKLDECTKAGHPCMLGQECVVERYSKKERCVCVEHCPFVPDAEVCGSDMMTYTTACHLYKKACDTDRMVFAVSAGSCDMMNKKHLKVEPKMAEACENSQTTFKCIHDSMIESIESWKKGDETLRPDDKFIIQDNTLTVRRVMVEDQGNYTCVTIDNNGTVKMATATLKMTQMPTANIPSNHISCEHGDQVMIPCEHNEDSQVSWMKNGFELDEGDGMYVDDTGMLVMQQTERGASGTYQCVASNFCGVSEAECSVNVTARDPNRCDEGVELVECLLDPCQDNVCEGRPELVCKPTRCGECGNYWEDEEMRKVTCPQIEAPEIINAQMVSLTPEGEDAVLSCETTGFPIPNITWTLNGGTPIDGLKKHSLRGDNTLVIRQLVMGLDNGRYTCTAENSAGTAESTVVVAILPRMTPMCPQTSDKIMKCENDFCATAKCPAYEGTNNVTCVNTVCNVCTYIFVDRSMNYVDCYSDPAVLKKMQQMSKMNMMGNMPGWPAGSSMGGGHGSMGGGSMGAMPGWPAASGSAMGAMPGWPAGSSMGGGAMGAMPGWPAGSSMGAMGAMPGWPAGSSMSGGSMGGGHGGGGGSMGAMPGWPAGSGSAMGAMPGWPAGSSMGGGSMGGGSMGGSGMGGMGNMDKNAWHFIPGWNGHMSQMKGAAGTGAGAGVPAQAQGGHGGGGGHLNVFYSGKPDDEEEEEDEDEES